MKYRVFLCGVLGLGWHGALWAGLGEAAAIRPMAAFELAPSVENQRMPAAAYGGGVFLAVWQEGWNGVGGNANIRGALVSPGVASNGTASLAICAAPDHQESPRVAFGGGVFLAVWHDFRNGKDADIYAARVSPAGKILDPDGIPVAARPHNQNFPEVCSNGKDFFILWRELRYGENYHLVGARVESATGKVLDPQGVIVSNSASLLPAVGFTGKRYIISWLGMEGRRNVCGFCRYDPQTLARDDSEPIRFGHPDAFGKMGDLRLISGPGEVVALWARGMGPDPWGWGGPGAILSTRLRDDGSVPENKTFNKIRWSPEGREQYTKRLLPGVLDTAYWKGEEDRWPQGKPGGFKGAENGLWPHAYVSGTAMPGVKDQYFAVWVRAHLSESGRADIMGGRLVGGETWAAPDFPPAELVTDGYASLPCVSAGEKGSPLFLVYEKVGPTGGPKVEGKFIEVQPAKGGQNE